MAAHSFVAAGVALLTGAGALILARAPSGAHPMSPNPAAAGAIAELRVPHLKGAVVLDGDMDDPGWQGAIARTNAFVASDGTEARPYSDARFVWGDGVLYVALYAADEDVRAGDSFQLRFGSGASARSFDVSATGAIRGAPLGAHVSRELDGTIDAPGDDDEEWVIEMAIPLEELGWRGEKGERIDLSIRRCDTLHSGVRSCGSWGEIGPRGALVLDGL